MQTIKIGNRLTPSETYYASIGALLAAGWRSEYAVDDPNTDGEKARLFIKEDKTVILYYPGKDNHRPKSADETTESLRYIIHTTLLDLDKNKPKINILGVQHIFIIAESNTFFFMPVQHYVVAFAEFKDNNCTVNIEDSINRNYDVQGIIDEIKCGFALSADIQYFPIKRGWQWPIFQNWQCGHYVIQAIYREATQNHVKEFKVNDAILEKHQEWFEKGYAISLVAKRHEHYSQSSSSSSSSIRQNDDDGFIVVTDHDDDDFVQLEDDDNTATKKSP